MSHSIAVYSVRFSSNYLQNPEKVRIFASEKVLLGSEGPGSTKAVYVAQAGLFLLPRWITNLHYFFSKNDGVQISYMRYLTTILTLCLLLKMPVFFTYSYHWSEIFFIYHYLFWRYKNLSLYLWRNNNTIDYAYYTVPLWSSVLLLF